MEKYEFIPFMVTYHPMMYPRNRMQTLPFNHLERHNPLTTLAKILHYPTPFLCINGFIIRDSDNPIAIQSGDPETRSQETHRTTEVSLSFSLPNRQLRQPNHKRPQGCFPRSGSEWDFLGIQIDFTVLGAVLNDADIFLEINKQESNFGGEICCYIIFLYCP